MSNKKQLQKLELTWIGKGEEPKLEPRILIENPEYSYGEPNSENMLIHGDNLLALKALEQEYAGKVKCIYIDPPYNTGNAFEHYDDGVEHSLWLNLIGQRIKSLYKLLAKDGTLWINLDDNEAHYCKVMCDEIFGRGNFVSNIVWQKRIQPDIRATLGAGHDHILVYAKNKELFKSIINPLPLKDSQEARYKNPDNDPKGPWVSADYMAKGYRPNQMYKIITPGGSEYYPRDGSCWRNVESVFLELVSKGEIWFGKDGKSVPRKKTYLSEITGIAAWTWWTNAEVGHNQEAKKEVNKIFGLNNTFETPKPERLLERVLTLASNEGDLVLDSFLGSGTTAAVAHKMGRRWIGVELGEHAKTHCVPRLKQVVDGEQGGISKAVNWQGGGGFKFYTLAPSLLKQDTFGNWVISQAYNADMLAAAMAKQEGFRYQPHESTYWKQGQSSEQDFIFTTTTFLTRDILESIANDLLPDESLLICCTQYEAGLENAYPNINLRKIPSILLNRCEFKEDSDYSLNIIDSPLDDLRPEQDEKIQPKSERKPANTTQMPDLFNQPND
ncbi:site-specific DNA-methyltransferase [Peijinzhouia sedimentorum]